MQWADVRKDILERDDGRCLRCGGLAADIHHRRPRGRGGTSDDAISFGPANLVALCRKDHELVHTRPRDAGYPSGLLVHSWENPEKVPVILGGVTIWLRPDGTTEREEDARF